MFRSREELALEEANKVFSNRHSRKYFDSDLTDTEAIIILCMLILTLAVICYAR
jgi:hypothetical protein